MLYVQNATLLLFELHMLEVIKETEKNAKAGKRVTDLQGFVNLRGPKLSFN